MVCDTEKSYLPIEKENRLGEKKKSDDSDSLLRKWVVQKWVFLFSVHFFFLFPLWRVFGLWRVFVKKKKKRELKIVLCVFVCVALLETMLGVLEDRVCPVWYESPPLMTDTMKANPTHKHGAKSQEKKEKKKDVQINKRANQQGHHALLAHWSRE